MSTALYSVLTIIIFIISLTILQLILNFFSISFADYSTYVFWMIALFLFSFFLPKHHTYF